MIQIRSYFTFWLSKIILKNASAEEKSFFRNLENSFQKLANAEQHLNFTNQCIQHGLSPIFTNIRLHNAATGSQPFVQRFRQDLVKHEEAKHRADVEALKNDLEQSTTAFKTLVGSNLRFDAFMKFLTRRS
jgi:hypothetical protein